MKRTALLIVTTCFDLAFFSGVNAQRQPSKRSPQQYATSSQSQKTQEVRVTGESKNWKIAIVSANLYRKIRLETSTPEEWQRCNLRVSLQIEYLGADGDVAAPGVRVLNGQNVMQSRLAMVTVDNSEFETRDWLFSNRLPGPRKKTRHLKTGDKFGMKQPVTYCIEVMPVGSGEEEFTLKFGELELVFEDIPPINLKPTEIK